MNPHSTVDGPGLAIVTGAARRVGRATALELARCGFDLLLTWRSGADEMAATASACDRAARDAGRPVRVSTERVDFADQSSLVEFTASIEQLPRLDALVLNASSYGSSPTGAVTPDDALLHYRVNALAPLLLAQAARGPLERSGLPAGGAIVGFSDVHVLGRPRIGYTAYSMSKGALTTMIECLAREFAPRIRVNAIAPGVVAWPDDTPDAERERYESRIPLGRSGTPDDAATLVRWLVLDASYVTGEVIRLDGGRWLR